MSLGVSSRVMFFRTSDSTLAKVLPCMPSDRQRKNEKGNLVGRLVMPMALGIVGGTVSTHPTARVSIKILGVKTASEFGEIAASAGLAYKLTALQMLVTKGINSFYKSSQKDLEKTRIL